MPFLHRRVYKCDLIIPQTYKNQKIALRFNIQFPEKKDTVIIFEVQYYGINLI